ncbi:hypothetical protein AJ78_01888 [Emergomyces pasteurianus Ep9510]|uniref:LIM zinc-binding domain-containing protein n=1 Tax=Emergomyces pasteurianus Ep9510 TaxID=1447872 RepID=A0A1J9PQ82_9EURO|nr:hypothetical protein AJ78_01888 [Emergomyces pasteurianus Ep9510]
MHERNGAVPLCETDFFRRLDMLCSECGGALRDLYISALGRKYHMDHFTCHSCQHVIGPGDNYYIHGGKAYCKDEYMAKYADRCYGCGMAIMDQYIKVYTPKKRIWHEGCYRIHKRHNPSSSSLADVLIVDGQDDESASLGMESIFNGFEAMVTSCISDSLEHLESGSHEKISGGILTLINALGVLFSSIEIVDDVRRKAGKTVLSDSPEIDLLRTKLTDFMTVCLSKSQETRTTSSHLKEMYAASSGLSYFMKKVIRIFKESTADIDLSAAPDYLDSLRKFPHEPPPATMNFSKMELIRGAELCQVCNSPISTECVSWDGYLRRQHLTCKSSCAQCDACETPQDMNLVLISPPGDSYALCCAACQNKIDMLGSHTSTADPVMFCKYITKLQQHVFVLRVQFEQLQNPYNYTERTMTAATATTTRTARFEKSQKQLDKGIFGRLSSINHRTAADEPAASSLLDRTPSDTFALGSMIGSSYQGLKKGFFGRSKAKGRP